MHVLLELTVFKKDGKKLTGAGLHQGLDKAIATLKEGYEIVKFYSSKTPEGLHVFVLKPQEDEHLSIATIVETDLLQENVLPGLLNKEYLPSKDSIEVNV